MWIINIRQFCKEAKTYLDQVDGLEDSAGWSDLPGSPSSRDTADHARVAATFELDDLNVFSNDGQSPIIGTTTKILQHANTFEGCFYENKPYTFQVP